MPNEYHARRRKAFIIPPFSLKKFVFRGFHFIITIDSMVSRKICLYKLVQIFIKFFQKNQILRAKITPCPCPKSGNILISHSHDLKDRFKAIKFMVGHFGWEHFACLVGGRPVKCSVHFCRCPCPKFHSVVSHPTSKPGS